MISSRYLAPVTRAYAACSAGLVRYTVAPQILSVTNLAALVQTRHHSHDSSPKGKKSHSSTRWLARDKNDFYTRKAKELNLRSRAGFKLQEINHKFQLIKKNQVQNIVDLGFAPGAWTQVAVSLAHPESKILGVDILPSKPPKGASCIQANIFSKRTHQIIYEFFVKNHEIMKHLKQRHGTPQSVNESLEQAQKHIAEQQQEQLRKEGLELARELGSKLSLEQAQGSSSIDGTLYENSKGQDGSNSTIRSNSGSGIEQDKPGSRQILDIVLSDMMANTTGLRAKDHMLSMDLCDAGLILSLELLKPGGSYICKFFAGKEDAVLEYRLRRSFNRVIRFKPDSLRSESTEVYFVCMGRKADATVTSVFVK